MAIGSVFSLIYLGMIPSMIINYGLELYQFTQKFPDQSHWKIVAVIGFFLGIGWYITIPVHLFRYRKNLGFQLRPLSKEWRWIAYHTKFPSLPRSSFEENR